MIPKVIHYCWFGGAPKPESVCRCIDSWRKHCPDFEIREWNEQNIDYTSNKYTRQAYEAKSWGFVPDYLRLWIIHEYGGIYMDTDVQVIKDLTPLLDQKGFAGFEIGTERFVAFGLGFGAEAGNSIIKEHMMMYDHLEFLKADGSYNKVPSPVYSTELLVKHGLDRGNKGIQKLGDFTVYPEEFFCPKSYSTGLTRKTKNTYSIHHYDASWYTEEERAAWKRDQKKSRLMEPIYRIKVFRYNVMNKVLGEEKYKKLKKLLKKDR